MAKIRKIYGLSSHPLFKAWKSMHERCYNKNNQNYKNYGARGITVCDRWFSLLSFIEDMYPKPSKKHSLDRINNDGNYNPNNCRWVLDITQQNNKRNNVYIEYNGKIKTLADWARYLNINYSTLKERRRLMIGSGELNLEKLFEPTKSKRKHPMNQKKNQS